MSRPDIIAANRLRGSSMLSSSDMDEPRKRFAAMRSEEHTSELQSRSDLVCRLLLEKKKKKTTNPKREKLPKYTKQAHQEILARTLRAHQQSRRRPKWNAEQTDRYETTGHAVRDV